MIQSRVRLSLWTLALCLLPSLSTAQPVDFALFQSSENTPPAAVAMRFVHSIAEVAAIRIDLDAETVVDSLLPRDRTGYIPLAAQPGVDHQLRVYSLGGPVPQLVLDMTVFFDAYGYVTALLVGDSGQTTVEFTSDTHFDGGGTAAFVSAFNADPDSQGFDVFDRATGEPFIFSGYFGSGYGGGVPAGTFDLEVRRHNHPDVVLTLNRVVLEAGRRYILIFSQPLLDRDSNSTIFVRADRFRLSAEWRAFDGRTGAGARYGSSSESGEFWFFAPTNIELIAKIVDGGALNGHYWTFVGALSNVQFDLTVFDRETRVARQYFNAEGIFASFGDIEAFPAP
jgi:hypothetical protein